MSILFIFNSKYNIMDIWIVDIFQHLQCSIQHPLIVSTDVRSKSRLLYWFKRIPTKINNQDHGRVDAILSYKLKDRIEKIKSPLKSVMLRIKYRPLAWWTRKVSK